MVRDPNIIILPDVGALELVIIHYLPKVLDSKILDEFQLIPRKYFLFSCHREENVDNDKNFFRLCEIIKELASIYELPIIFSVHPRTRLRIEKHKISFPTLVNLVKPLGYFDYLKL